MFFFTRNRAYWFFDSLISACHYVVAYVIHHKRSSDIIHCNLKTYYQILPCSVIGTWMVIWWPVVSEILNIKIRWLSLLQVSSDSVGIFFEMQCFFSSVMVRCWTCNREVIGFTPIPVGTLSCGYCTLMGDSLRTVKLSQLSLPSLHGMEIKFWPVWLGLR